MKLIVTFSAVFFTILAIQNNASAIRCYECTNEFGGECGKVNNDMITNCTESVACIKANLKSSSKEVFARSCGAPILVYNNTCTELKNGNETGTVCECSTDLCNNAPNVVIRFAVFIPILIAIILKYT